MSRFLFTPHSGFPIRLLFGLLASIVLWVGIIGLATAIPGYSQVRQTVSEIGQIGSPMRAPFTVMLCLVALCLIIFAAGLKDVARDQRLNPLAASLVGCMAFSAAGVGLFAYPHPLHNIFGLSELVGYQAPLAMALTWKGSSRDHIRRFSWILYGLLIMALAANLSVLDRQGTLWRLEKPVYGLVQRFLFLAWFVWSAGASLMLTRHAQFSQ
jgi:hypothetical membrane protein